MSKRFKAIEILNLTKSPIPKKFIKTWVSYNYIYLNRKKILKGSPALTIVFVGASRMKSLNSKFRNKKRPTDILSFEPIEKNSLGELVLCLPVLKRQSQEHGLSLKLEVGYMLTHGILHLLGYDHEKSERSAKKMFQLQDKIFDTLRKKA